MQFSFTTMEGLVAHFSHWLPPQYVHNLIEAEKEVFVVRQGSPGSLEDRLLQDLHPGGQLRSREQVHPFVHRAWPCLCLGMRWLKIIAAMIRN